MCDPFVRSTSPTCGSFLPNESKEALGAADTWLCGEDISKPMILLSEWPQGLPGPHLWDHSVWSSTYLCAYFAIAFKKQKFPDAKQGCALCISASFSSQDFYLAHSG